MCPLSISSEKFRLSDIAAQVIHWRSVSTHRVCAHNQGPLAVYGKMGSAARLMYTSPQSERASERGDRVWMDRRAKGERALFTVAFVFTSAFLHSADHGSKMLSRMGIQYGGRHSLPTKHGLMELREQ